MIVPFTPAQGDPNLGREGAGAATERRAMSPGRRYRLTHFPADRSRMSVNNYRLARYRTMSKDATKYRGRAAICEAYAARATSQMDKEGWLRLAAEWTKLARSAEMKSGEKSGEDGDLKSEWQARLRL